MKIILAPAGSQGFGFFDALIVVATLALSAIVLLTVPFGISRPATRSSRISCVNNLRQLGIAARTWSEDHSGQFVWQVPISSTGSMEFGLSGDVARILLPMSNELSSPEILRCPTDEKRKVATTCTVLQTRNVSYFIGLDADGTVPQTILWGDRNVRGGLIISNRVMIVSSASNIVFGSDIHQSAGNLGLGDGSAQQVNQVGLRRQILAQEQSMTNNRVRWALP